MTTVAPEAGAKPKMSPWTKDITGQVFGRLTVIEFAGYRSDPKSGVRRAQWVCLCVCGEEVTVRAECLKKRGNTTSCGCYRRDQASKTGKANTKEFVSYDGAHARVRRVKGPASTHACFCGCGVVAAHWSYQGGDDDELLGDDGNGSLCYYSLSVDYYEPMTVKCHKAFDAEARKLREGGR